MTHRAAEIDAQLLALSREIDVLFAKAHGRAAAARAALVFDDAFELAGLARGPLNTVVVQVSQLTGEALAMRELLQRRKVLTGEQTREGE